MMIGDPKREQPVLKRVNGRRGHAWFGDEPRRVMRGQVQQMSAVEVGGVERYGKRRLDAGVQERPQSGVDGDDGDLVRDISQYWQRCIERRSGSNEYRRHSLEDAFQCSRVCAAGDRREVAQRVREIAASLPASRIRIGPSVEHDPLNLIADVLHEIASDACDDRLDDDERLGFVAIEALPQGCGFVQSRPDPQVEPARVAPHTPVAAGQARLRQIR
jgi:hypothetical protein